MKRSPKPLQSKGTEIRFYEGDVEKLRDILAPKPHLTVSWFVRELVALKLRQIEERANIVRTPIDGSDVELSIGTGDAGEPGGPVQQESAGANAD